MVGAIAGSVIGAVLSRGDPESDLFAFTFGLVGWMIGVTLGLVLWLVTLWHGGSKLALPVTVVTAGVLGLFVFFGLVEDDLTVWLILGVPAAAACALLVATLWRLVVFAARAAR